MAELKESAAQFLDDLIANNVGGLMAVFTPEGMTKAMAIGQGGGPQGTPTNKTVVILDAEGEDHPVDLVVDAEEGQAIIGTVWRDVAGTWKVNDIQIKKMP
jgi:hypothetical protein